MNIIKNLNVPTGNILIVEGKHGLLECLSIGDYGKEKNLKADFLDLKKEIHGVPHGDLLPLSEKWVITISSQYGCSMGCSFCDVPKVGPGRNATKEDMVAQVLTSIRLHPEVQETKRLNVHFARMGEPTFNWSVIDAAKFIKEICDCLNFKYHPVVSTMMPKANKKLDQFLAHWLWYKNNLFKGEAGLQLSINTTDEDLRKKQFNNNALTLQEICNLFEEPALSNQQSELKGRKITLNFALTDAPIDAHKLKKLFNPKYFLCKITPMHMTNSCKENKLETTDGYTDYYPYQEVERELKNAGFDVIVFIPSKEEDESRITCGNAILSDN